MVCDRPQSPRRLASWRPFLALTCLCALSACGSLQSATHDVAESLSVYRPEVVQGNFVSKEQVAVLKPGMSRLQVRDILGTPLLTSLFRSERWDYVFTLNRPGAPLQRYQWTVFFKNDVLDHFEGDNLPSESSFVQAIDKPSKLTIPPLQATPAQLAAFPAAPQPATSNPADNAASPPSGGYPPLEAPQ